jgi:hypothetical protein
VAVCTACRAQPPENAVLAVYRQMEKAEQAGDGQAWIELWSPKSRIRLGGLMKDMIRPQPSVRYQAIKVLVRGDQAALIGRSGEQYLSMRFVREIGAWKILDQAWSNVAIDPASIYTLVLPEDGAFARAGSPWENVPRASANPKYFKPAELRWKLQSVRDESFVYVRIEAASVLPAPNTEVKGTFPNLKSGVPRDWPVMKILVLGAAPREYIFDVADGIGDQATFDEQGKANSHRYFVTYSLSLRKGENTVFTASNDASADPLISVAERFIDLRIPLRTLGIETAAASIEIRDANAPIGTILPYEVTRFGR